MSTIAALLKQGSQALAPVSPTPQLDAEVLLAHVMQKPRSHLRAWPEATPSAAVREAFLQLLERRCAGEPVAYLMGKREFWSRDFLVAPQVLIPRPDTELLVEKALERIPAEAHPRVADLGTGSGAVAISLALERPDARVFATDLFPRALVLARKNTRLLGAANVCFIHTDWLTAFPPGRLDVIVSNPPYIAAEDPHLNHEIRFEPATALVGGDDGLVAIHEIAVQAPRCLKPGGWLLLEHGYDQASQVARLLAESGFDSIYCHHDLQGHPRVTQAQWSP